jgi:transposase
MEDILDLYERSYHFRYPIVCLDEKPYQLLRDILSPLPPEPGKPWREDYTYERNGTCNLFVIFCPGLGWRHVEVTGQRTAIDYAEILRKIVDEYFPQADRILIVQDNLNTHTGASLYKAFDAREALRIHRKLEFHYTPKHASWLNMAEIEIHALGKQCIDRRMGDVDTLKRETAAWERERNQRQVKVNWLFTVGKARDKFQRDYDKLSI